MKFKIIFSIAVALLSFLMVSGTALAGADAIQIYTLEDLMNIGTPENLSGNYILMADINVGAEETDDLKFVPIGGYNRPFRGTFNGNNHTISNITFSNNKTSYVGLFGCTQKAVISDLSLKNVDIIGKDFVGALIGYASVTTIKNCSVTNSDGYGIFGREHVGGLISIMDVSSVFDCYAATNVTGEKYVGGLVGLSLNSVVSDSNAVGNVKGRSHVGGLVGSFTNKFISGSSAIGNVDGHMEVGGLVGYMENSSISECYATGAVYTTISSGGYAGGLVGAMNLSTVSCSYAAGDVIGYAHIGGLAGRVYDGSAIRDSFYIGTPSSTNSSFGFFITPDELRQISTFTTLKSDGGRVSTSWNISSEPDSGSVWYINEGIGYPQLFKNYVPPELPDLPDLPPSIVSPNGDDGSSGYGKAEIIDSEPMKPEPSISLPEPEIIEALDSLPVSENQVNSMVEPIGSMAESAGSMTEKTGSGGTGILLIGLFVILGCVLIITLRQR